MRQLILMFPERDGLIPVSEYLHPALWVVGEKTQQEKKNYSNFSMLELLYAEFNANKLNRINIIGDHSIEQLQTWVNQISNEYNIKTTLQILHEKYSAEQLINLEDEDLIIYPGHILTNANLSDFVNFDLSHNGLGTLLVMRGVKYRVGITEIEKGTQDVLRFREKPFIHDKLAYTSIFTLKKGWKKYLIQFLSQVWDPTTTKSILRKHGYKSSLHLFVKFLIKNGDMKIYEMESTKTVPWFKDLSQLETWMKLNTDEIYDNLKSVLEQY